MGYNEIREQSQPPPMHPTLMVTAKGEPLEMEKAELSAKDKYLDKVFIKASDETSFSEVLGAGNTEVLFKSSDSADGRNVSDSDSKDSGVGLVPTHNWVIIEPKEKESSTKSGIEMPQTAARSSNEGVVVAVGPGVRSFRPDIAERNILIMAEYEERLARAVSSGNARAPLAPVLEDVYEHIPIDLRVGDRVLYIRWAAYSVEVDNKKFYLVEEHNVLCVADNPDSELAFWQEKH